MYLQPHQMADQTRLLLQQQAYGSGGGSNNAAQAGVGGVDYRFRPRSASGLGRSNGGSQRPVSATATNRQIINSTVSASIALLADLVQHTSNIPLSRLYRFNPYVFCSILYYVQISSSAFSCCIEVA